MTRTARLGAHMSIAGGMPNAVARAVTVGAGALQVFVKSANQWAARPFAEGEAAEFRRATAAAGLEHHTIAHASYLINLASLDDALWSRSIDALGVELDRCADLGIGALVVHPGSPKGGPADRGIARVARALERAYGSRRRGGRRSVATLLENTAGQGTALGSRFDEIGEIIRRCRAEDRVGVCLDTCHAVAAGYPLAPRAAWRATMRSFADAVGFGRLRAIHLNDSKGRLGSRVDRHEHIGKGAVGLEGFRLVLTDPRLEGLPMVLETEKGDDLAEDRRNLDVLRGLLSDP